MFPTVSEKKNLENNKNVVLIGCCIRIFLFWTTQVFHIAIHENVVACFKREAIQSKRE